jgi:hypothetical protein
MKEKREPIEKRICDTCIKLKGFTSKDTTTCRGCIRDKTDLAVAKARKAKLTHLTEEQRLALKVKRYGISAERYRQILENQNGLCAICLRDKELVIDHNHDTGEVRGLLCTSCNTGIGLLGDSDVSRMERALSYIKVSNKQIQAN